MWTILSMHPHGFRTTTACKVSICSTMLILTEHLIHEWWWRFKSRVSFSVTWIMMMKRGLKMCKITLTCTRILQKKESSGCHLLDAKSKEICSKHNSGAGNLLSWWLVAKEMLLIAGSAVADLAGTFMVTGIWGVAGHAVLLHITDAALKAALPSDHVKAAFDPPQGVKVRAITECVQLLWCDSLSAVEHSSDNGWDA